MAKTPHSTTRLAAFLLALSVCSEGGWDGFPGHNTGHDGSVGHGGGHGQGKVHGSTGHGKLHGSMGHGGGHGGIGHRKDHGWLEHGKGHGWVGHAVRHGWLGREPTHENEDHTHHGCPDDFYYVKSSSRRFCYAVLSTPMTWDDANRVCRSRNPKAHLLIVRDAVENDLLRLPFESVSASSLKRCTPDSSNHTLYWTAGQSANPQTRFSDKFFWKYGRANNFRRPVNYTNWVPSWSTTDTTCTTIVIDGNPHSDTYTQWVLNPSVIKPCEFCPTSGRCVICEIDVPDYSPNQDLGGDKPHQQARRLIAPVWSA